MKRSLFFSISIGIAFLASAVSAQQSVQNATPSDPQLAEKLKQELQFDIQRKKGFNGFEEKKTVFEREREKGLSMFLEEQEKFDIAREKGKEAYRSSKKKRSMDESSPEYYADLREKDKQQAAREKSRQVHVQTRNRIISQYSHESHLSEEQEFGLDQIRPRYDLRKRGSNKWTRGSGATGSSGSRGSSPGGFGSPMDVPPPVPDYIPQPVDNFEEIPPPPPIPYDESMSVPGFDSGFGEAPLPPPPPPPPEGGWDF